MNTDRDQNKKQQTEQTGNNQREKKHSSEFNEPSHGDEKSTANVEEKTELEQERKEAMTERD